MINSTLKFRGPYCRIRPIKMTNHSVRTIQQQQQALLTLWLNTMIFTSRKLAGLFEAGGDEKQIIIRVANSRVLVINNKKRYNNSVYQSNLYGEVTLLDRSTGHLGQKQNRL